jgi:hypothetical protein
MFEMDKADGVRTAAPGWLKRSLDAAPATRPTAEAATSTDRLHAVIQKLRDHVAAIQAAKARVDAGRSAPENNPILQCVNDLPGIVRELDMAELEIEADFEALGDAA